MVRTRFSNSKALPHSPDPYDPRMVVSQSRIELDPWLKRMWAGYAFAIDLRGERGHPYMLEDQTTVRDWCWQPPRHAYMLEDLTFTQRHKKPQLTTACSATHPCM